VVSGDTLSKLAKSYLGDASRYMEIFKANSDSLSSPDVIKIGQRLNIPMH
jgi:nucleoid-associated protein YgaU